MSIERIHQLHEQASECYLSGDYRGALKAWRDVLELDPKNEQALGGVHLASQFVEPDAPAFAAVAPDIESELERGLKVLGGSGAAKLLDPDFADGSIDRKPEPDPVEMPAVGDALDGWEAPAASSDDEGSFGLDPVPAAPPAPTAPASAAAFELKRRVDDLLAEAKAKAEAGERDEALSILARLSILDEDNAEAEALRSKIETDGASHLDKIEQSMTEGVAAIEADRLDDAERHFREALALAPEHREARHYLEKVTERRLSGGEDLLGPAVGESAPAEDAVQRAIGIATPARTQETEPKAPRSKRSPSDALDLPSAAGRPRFSLPRPRTLILGGVGAVVLVCAALALPRFLHGSASKAPPPKPTAPVSRAGREAKGGAAQKGAAAAQTRVAPGTSEELEQAVASHLTTGRSLMASGDFGGAVLAFNEAVTLDPGNAAAKEGLAAAGERYKAGKVERDAMDNIRLAFRDGEFRSVLRLAYRLPPSVNTSSADGIKVAGWYNLAVVALRAGECREAQAHLDEALAIAPADAEAKKLREFASGYAEAVKDRVFLGRVEALSFRPLPSP